MLNQKSEILLFVEYIIINIKYSLLKIKELVILFF